MHRTTLALIPALLALLLSAGVVVGARSAPDDDNRRRAGQLTSVAVISVRCATDTCSGLDLRFADGGRVAIAAPGDARDQWSMIAETGSSRADQDYAALLAQAIGTRDPAALAQALNQALRR